MAKIVVIPARLASERFPEKLLKAETGRPLIQHVYDRCRQARGIDRVIVAADGDRIAHVVRAFGGEAIVTRPELPSGTDRVAAAVLQLQLDTERDFIANVQGDEPEIDPAHIELLFELLVREAGSDGVRAAAATLATAMPAATQDEVQTARSNPNRVKVVLDRDGHALYFSRAGIPYPRVGAAEWLCHVGIYGFRPAALQRFTATAPTPLECIEKLEQLRFLELGLKIRVGIVDRAAPGIDTPADYREFVARERQAAACSRGKSE
ncbi:MAG: 3-deoxy-manno-octulosonate cytidylyltransferase [Planctomycetota bacterium]